MSLAITTRQRTERAPLSTLENLTVRILAMMVLVWITFQIVDLQPLFPPIGILYALGSIAVAAVIVFSRRLWSPALAAGWGVVMMIPESIPAVDHLLHWGDLSTHFGHYLVIMTFSHWRSRWLRQVSGRPSRTTNVSRRIVTLRTGYGAQCLA